MSAAPDYRETIAALEESRDHWKALWRETVKEADARVAEAERRGSVKGLREFADDLFEGRTLTIDEFERVARFANALYNRADRIEAES